MTPLEELNKKYKPIIERLAWKYCIRNHCKLDYEELRAEGYCKFSELLHTVTVDFEKIFYRSLSNHYISLLRNAFNDKHSVYTIDLSEAYWVAGPDHLDEVFMNEVVRHLEAMLTHDSWEVLKEMLFPHDALIQQEVEAAQLITNGTIARALGLTTMQFRGCMLEIERRLSTLGIIYQP